ncbi:MAG: hypothetical protein K8S15_01170 [Candidatus Aegiribacteria sp.]|nr:hypothetical protein [Candidatus Aegiribacteria sp.]
MLFSIVREAADMGLPISLVLPEEYMEFMDLPQEWTIHMGGNTTDSWIAAFDAVDYRNCVVYNQVNLVRPPGIKESAFSLNDS